MNSERWQIVSPQLDCAIEMEDDERSAWLQSLRAEDSELAADLEVLLDEHRALDREGFLESAPPLPLHALRVDREESADCGPYRHVRLLGSGGMGAVYLAERSDGELQRQVAVKLLHRGADRPAWRDRFLKERQLLASLNHPAIAHMVDAGHTADGRPYLVMEYVDGVPIDVYASGKDLRDQLLLFLRVCDAVSHAHRHLIIHRDLKPSNILVEAGGQPKLLDFGIAKLLDATGDPTQTVERMLTPNYASPEQLRGASQTTATDVYSLAAVLYKLLTGRSPNEPDTLTARHVDVITRPGGIPAPSRLNPDLPTDLDYILRKALRYEPEERYVSVEAMANDIHAFLDFRPVQARSGDTWYRTRKWLRRHWVPAVAATVTMVGLSLGLYVANRGRAMAQQRFEQVRQLANRVLALDSAMQGIPGATKARHEVVAMSKEYLEALAPAVRADPDLALEIGAAYLRLARAQGVPTGPNLGQYAQAEESLRRAEALVEPVLEASPGNREALLTSAQVSEARMAIAESSERRDEALAYARRAAARLDTIFGLGQPSQDLRAMAVVSLGSIALVHRRVHRFEDGILYARRSVEIARSLPASDARVGQSLSVLADLLRISGDLGGALEAIQEARSSVERAVFPNEMTRRAAWYSVLVNYGQLLGIDGSINLGQPDEAIAVLYKAFDVVEDWAQRDPNDASSRLQLAFAGRLLANILRHRDPARALAIYDHALRRLGEIQGNVKAHREETRLLAGSSYALRRLNRTVEARDRIDAAFRLLRETRDYPTERISPYDDVETVVRALADHHAETGQPQRAVQVYEALLDRIMASKPDLGSNLSHAAKLSRVYEALAELHRRTGRQGKFSRVAALRLGLWRQWDRRLPNNAFVRRQLAAAGPQAP